MDEKYYLGYMDAIIIFELILNKSEDIDTARKFLTEVKKNIIGMSEEDGYRRGYVDALKLSRYLFLKYGIERERIDLVLSKVMKHIKGY